MSKSTGHRIAVKIKLYFSFCFTEEIQARN